MNIRMTTSLALLALALAAPGCAALTKIFTGDKSADAAGPSEPDADLVALLDEDIAKHVAYLAERPVEAWPQPEANASLSSFTERTYSLAVRYGDDEANARFRTERFAKLHAAYAAYFARARPAAIADGDPELAQQLTTVEFALQEEFFWAVEREDLISELREQAVAIADHRQAIFAKRGEYNRLNEAMCLASDAPLAEFGAAQPGAKWHFPKASEVHVRCVFPTSLESQVSGGMTFKILGVANVWGSTGEGAGKRLELRIVEIPVEVERYRSGPWFDFAFDLGDATKGFANGFVRINGVVAWSVVDEYRAVEEHESIASIRISFE